LYRLQNKTADNDQKSRIICKPLICEQVVVSQKWYELQLNTYRKLNVIYQSAVTMPVTDLE